MTKQITIRMPKADLKMVLAMLRNPANANKQGRAKLFNPNIQYGGYCCLGAMQCAKTGGFVETYPDGLFKSLPSSGWLNSVGWEFFTNHGNKGENPYLPSLSTYASEANDEEGYTFAQIADAIEDCAEGY